MDVHQGILWDEPSVESILLNLVDGGGVPWQMDLGGGHMTTLQAGIQVLNISLPANATLHIQPNETSASAKGKVSV